MRQANLAGPVARVWNQGASATAAAPVQWRVRPSPARGRRRGQGTRRRAQNLPVEGAYSPDAPALRKDAVRLAGPTAQGRPATRVRNSSSENARKVSELTFPFDPSASAALAATVSSGASTSATMS
jgi:hypothetical protein